MVVQKEKTFEKVSIISLLCFFILTTVTFQEPTAIHIPDKDLEQAIRDKLGVPAIVVLNTYMKWLQRVSLIV